MDKKNDLITFEPIGFFSTDKKHRFETPRQGIYAKNNEGIIKLKAHKNFEQALRDLSGFDRIWVIYHIHLNNTWKPIVKPPVTGIKKKISVFATRSPHRPNSIGMSCIELVKIEGLNIYVKNFDLLDKTPILDIKPYIPSSDSFPNAATGWLPKNQEPDFICNFSNDAQKQIEWIYQKTDLDLGSFAELQLGYEPLNNSRKRVYAEDLENNQYIIACRTWRICFKIDEKLKKIYITKIKSGYESNELLPGVDDKYNDKDFHRAFGKIW